MKLTRLVAGILALIGVLAALTLFQTKKGQLNLIACDVGQGDAVLAVMGETQILIDGGPNNLVLDCLAKYLPFYDREIELIILTHNQTDHFRGLIEVFKRYQVDTFLVNEANLGGVEYQVLENEVGGTKTKVIYPEEGTTIRLGMIYLDIINPLRENVLGANSSEESVNANSIVVNLRLNNFDALLTGDLSPEAAESLVQRGLVKDVEYIKIPHHGSKVGLTENLLLAAKPELAVISVGKNSYGHPHQEILNLLNKYNIKTLRTDNEGDIKVETDGETWQVY
jgi:competence protein ComEC